jgi:hypothetical protein
MRPKFFVAAAVVCLALLATGIAIGQRSNESTFKFRKYLQPTSKTDMDIVALETTVETMRSLMPMSKGISTPSVYFNYKEAQPQAIVLISPEFEKGSLDGIKSQIADLYYLTYLRLKASIPELVEDDFLLKVIRVTRDPDHNLFAECRHGNIVFH